MTILDVELAEESKTRYLTYALSVVSSRALPDVRDGLKPVQRRILYAMASQLNLTPERHHRKSAAVVGEVLARFHPHGDAACYEAMVRMAQDFSLRYPLVDGQGNFGSLDGDSAAAYRYTEARLRAIAMEVVGEIGEETVVEKDNFDQTTKEPIVLPSRVPNLLINGAAGIAVGMATAIPPHNLREVVKALLLVLEDEEIKERKLLSAIKGPDFPTACQILNSQAELKEIYATGRGAIRMRAGWKLEKGSRGKEYIIVTSVPYGIDKSALVEKVADLIVARKVPQLVDIRDESTDEVRVVLELASGADAELAMAYLFRHTTLEHNFNVNLTALVPTGNPLSQRPVLLSLKEMLLHFINFRIEVTKAKLVYERGKLEDRIHLLEGLMAVIDHLDQVIKIVKKSEGRSDAAEKLQAKFSLSEKQAYFVVDLRIYQLSRASVEEISEELASKKSRVAEINRIVKSDKSLRAEVAEDLKRVSDTYGDDRRSEIISDFTESEFDEEEYVQHEAVYVVVTADGWLKRISSSSDPETTRIREGDKLFFVAKTDTRNSLIVFSSLGNVFASAVYDVVATTGFGEPVQKLFRFQDGEQVVACMVLSKEELASAESKGREVLLYTADGLGFRLSVEQLYATKKVGKRVVKVAEGDTLRGVVPVDKPFVLVVSEQGYSLCYPMNEIPLLSGAGKGVILQKLPKDDQLALAVAVDKSSKVLVQGKQGAPKELDVSSMQISGRAKRGLKLVKRGGPVQGLAASQMELFKEAMQ